jgi:CBS-domain-containing membrane protein
MIVEDFMTRRVIAVGANDSIVEAAKLMLKHKISGLPVVDATRHVVGIVSEHDLLRRRESNGSKQRSHWLQLMLERAELSGESARFHDRKVNEVMTPNPVTVMPTSSLEDACRLIENHGIKRLPVVQNGELIGIIARADLVRALAHDIQSAATAATRDVSVDERLRALERQNLRNRARVSKPF